MLCPMAALCVALWLPYVCPMCALWLPHSPIAPQVSAAREEVPIGCPIAALWGPPCSTLWGPPCCALCVPHGCPIAPLPHRYQQPVRRFLLAAL